jgi:hypothetical protein
MKNLNRTCPLRVAIIGAEECKNDSTETACKPGHTITQYAVITETANALVTATGDDESLSEVTWALITQKPLSGIVKCDNGPGFVFATVPNNMATRIETQ